MIQAVCVFVGVYVVALSLALYVGHREAGPLLVGVDYPRCAASSARRGPQGGGK